MILVSDFDLSQARKKSQARTRLLAQVQPPRQKTQKLPRCNSRVIEVMGWGAVDAYGWLGSFDRIDRTGGGLDGRTGGLMGIDEGGMGEGVDGDLMGV